MFAVSVVGRLFVAMCCTVISAGTQVLFCRYVVYCVPVLFPVPKRVVTISPVLGFPVQKELLIKLLPDRLIDAHHSSTTMVIVLAKKWSRDVLFFIGVGYNIKECLVYYTPVDKKMQIFGQKYTTVLLCSCVQVSYGEKYCVVCYFGLCRLMCALVLSRLSKYAGTIKLYDINHLFVFWMVYVLPFGAVCTTGVKLVSTM